VWRLATTTSWHIVPRQRPSTSSSQYLQASGSSALPKRDPSSTQKEGHCATRGVPAPRSMMAAMASCCCHFRWLGQADKPILSARAERDLGCTDAPPDFRRIGIFPSRGLPPAAQGFSLILSRRPLSHSSPCPRLSASRQAASSSSDILFET